MQTDHIASEESRKVSDLLHLFQPGGSGFGGDQPDGFLDRRDIGIAFSVKPTENAGQLDAVLIELLQKRFGRCGSSTCCVRCMQLDRRDSEFSSHIEMNTKPCVDAREYTNGPRGESH